MSVDPDDLRRIDQGLADISIISGRSMDSLLRGATVQAARSAQSLTHAFSPGKKRPSKKITIAQNAKGRALREKRGFPWWAKYEITAWAAASPKSASNTVKIYARTDSSRDKKRAIPNKGAAKRAWIFSLRRLDAGKIGAPKAIDKIASTYNKTMIRRDGRNVKQVTMINTVNYNQLANHGAVREATRRTGNWVQKRIEIEEAKIVRAFARRARRLV